MANTWMVRAGERGWRFDEFEKQSVVTIGWPEMGDLTTLRAREDFVRQAAQVYKEANRFMSSIERGGQNPGVMSVLRVAKAMGLSAAELLARAGL